MIDEHIFMQKLVAKIADKKQDVSLYTGTSFAKQQLKSLVESALDFALFAVRDALDETIKEAEDAK